MDEQLLKDALAALRALSTNPHLHLGDLVYKVRDSELQGWDGPSVKAWSDAVVAATKVLERAEAAGL